MTAASATKKPKPRKKKPTPREAIEQYQSFLRDRASDLKAVTVAHKARTKAEAAALKEAYHALTDQPKPPRRPVIKPDPTGAALLAVERGLLLECDMLATQRGSDRMPLNVRGLSRARARLMALIQAGGSGRLRFFDYVNGRLTWDRLSLSARARTALTHLHHPSAPPPKPDFTLKPCGPKQTAMERLTATKLEAENEARGAREIREAVTDGQQPATVFIPPIPCPEP